MKIGIVSDHRGYLLKKELIRELKKEYLIIDEGCNSEESVDFPDYALILGKRLQQKEIDLGIAICGTGIGMSIALNKMNGIMCAKINSIEEAHLAKEHNHVNALALGANDMDFNTAYAMIQEFIKTKENNNKKYLQRIEKIQKYQEEQK